MLTFILNNGMVTLISPNSEFNSQTLPSCLLILRRFFFDFEVGLKSFEQHGFNIFTLFSGIAGFIYFFDFFSKVIWTTRVQHVHCFLVLPGLYVSVTSFQNYVTDFSIRFYMTAIGATVFSFVYSWLWRNILVTRLSITTTVYYVYNQLHIGICA